MKVIVDTHTLIWFLFASGKLSEKARESIFDAKIIFIPTIVLLEGIYVSRKLRFESDFKEFISKLPSPIFRALSLDLDTVHSYIDLEHDLEIHDRIIVSSAKLLDVPIITKDKSISKIYPKVIW